MSAPRYGIWVSVGGNFGPLNTLDEPINASYERTRSLVFRSRTFRICRNLSRIAPFQLDKKLTCNT